MKRILVTGSLGQIGTELVTELRNIYGEENVIETDIREKDVETGIFEKVDVMDADQLFSVAKKYNVDTLIHLAAILSATAENNPKFAWDLNMNGLLNALEVARALDLKFFTPSSIGAFGPTTPKDLTPQETIQRPVTMYGVNKVAGELLCDYYYHKYGVDTRGVRFPGLISYVTPPGGGTTDYAVEIYYEAIRNKSFTSNLKEGTYLDMMYMPDAIQAIIQLMEANPEKLVHRNAYNITAFSAAPEDFAREIQKHIPDFEMSYQVDPLKQQIADSWPNSLDATKAREEWGFTAVYDIESTTKDMLERLKDKLYEKEAGTKLA